MTTAFKKAGAATAGADKPDLPDLYDLLGLTEPDGERHAGERYAIDRDQLEQNYLERSKSVHPDRFATAPTADRVRALQASMQLNEAYQTLRNPVARAEYLLARRGVTIGANEVLDPEFLGAVLEAREELGEAIADRDSDKLAALERTMQARRARALTEMAEAFAAAEAAASADDGAAGEHLERIKRELIILRYVDRYLEQVDHAIEAAEEDAS